MNIPLILEYLRPGEEYALDGESYTGLHWLAGTTKPTEHDLAAAEKDALAAAEAKAAAAASGRRKIAETSGLTPEEMAALGIA